MQIVPLLLAFVFAACSDSKQPPPAASVTVDVTDTGALAVRSPSSAEALGDGQAGKPSGPAVRTIDKGDGLTVEILVAGDGPVLKTGDEVSLEYTISYMPRPVDPSKEKEAEKKGAKGDTKKRDSSSSKSKADDKKPHDAKPDDTKSKAGAGEDAKKEEPKKDDAKTSEAKTSEEKPADAKKDEAKPPDEPKKDDTKKDETKKSDAKPDDVKKDDAKPADAKTPDTKSDKPAEKPAEIAPAKPLEPVVIASTKGWTTPFTCKLGSDSKPALLPGLVRGLEGLKVGTRARITIPPELAYGKAGSVSAGIPAETPIQIEVVVKAVHG